MRIELIHEGTHDGLIYDISTDVPRVAYNLNKIFSQFEPDLEVNHVRFMIVISTKEKIQQVKQKQDNLIQNLQSAIKKADLLMEELTGEKVCFLTILKF